VLALIPGELDRRHVATSAVLVSDVVGRGSLFRTDGRAVRLDGGGMAQFERPEGHVIPMTAEVGQRAAAEVPVRVPFRLAADVAVMKRAYRRRPQPQIPMQIRGHGLN